MWLSSSGISEKLVILTLSATNPQVASDHSPSDMVKLMEPKPILDGLYPSSVSSKGMVCARPLYANGAQAPGCGQLSPLESPTRRSLSLLLGVCPNLRPLLL